MSDIGIAEKGSLLFGAASFVLYLGWASFAYFTSQRHMTGALICYAAANVFLMWPLIRMIK